MALKPVPEARRAKQKQAIEDRKSSQKILLRDVKRLERYGSVTTAMRAFCRDAEDESGALIRSLGGHDKLSASELVLIGDLAMLRAIQSASFSAWLSGEQGAADRIPALVASRRATLQLLGLDRRKVEETLKSFVDGVTP